MLHAVEKNKTSRAKQYAEKFRHRRPTDHLEIEESPSSHKKNLKSEDEITSSIFGPMEFFAPDHILRFWRELTGQVLDESSSNWDMKLKLWPKINGIEPDGLFIFENPEKTKLIILLEIKWNTGLGKDQLPNQWNCLDSDERKCAMHVFIGKFVAAVGNDANIKAISWHQFRHALSNLRKANSQYPKEMKRWAELSDIFLEKSGIIKFGGFSSLLDSTIDQENLFFPQTIFWQPFNG